MKAAWFYRTICHQQCKMPSSPRSQSLLCCPGSMPTSLPHPEQAREGLRYTSCRNLNLTCWPFVLLSQECFSVLLTEGTKPIGAQRSWQPYRTSKLPIPRIHLADNDNAAKNSSYLACNNGYEWQPCCTGCAGRTECPERAGGLAEGEPADPLCQKAAAHGGQDCKICAPRRWEARARLPPPGWLPPLCRESQHPTSYHWILTRLSQQDTSP